MSIETAPRRSRLPRLPHRAPRPEPYRDQAGIRVLGADTPEQCLVIDQVVDEEGQQGVHYWYAVSPARTWLAFDPHGRSRYPYRLPPIARKLVIGGLGAGVGIPVAVLLGGLGAPMTGAVIFGLLMGVVVAAAFGPTVVWPWYLRRRWSPLSVIARITPEFARQRVAELDAAEPDQRRTLHVLRRQLEEIEAWDEARDGPRPAWVIEPTSSESMLYRSIVHEDSEGRPHFRGFAITSQYLWMVEEQKGAQVYYTPRKKKRETDKIALGGLALTGAGLVYLMIVLVLVVG